MEHENPYAPPTEGDAPEPARGSSVSDTAGLTFSEQDWAIVTEMAKWMRFVANVLFAAAVFVTLGALASMCSLAAGGPTAVIGAAGAAIFLALAVVLFLSRTWLKRAAEDFTFGVIDNATNPLASGFRNLRLYLILYGIFGLFSLAGSILPFFAGTMGR